MYNGDITLKVAKLKRGFGIVSGYNILREILTNKNNGYDN